MNKKFRNFILEQIIPTVVVLVGVFVWYLVKC